MGSTHFLTKTLPKVSTEMSLHVLAYNFKRMLSILGSQALIRAMGARGGLFTGLFKAQFKLVSARKHRLIKNTEPQIPKISTRSCAG
jgi:hypothetical protein